MKQTTLSFERSIFLDSSSPEEIKKWNATGVIDGVTTNQMIMLRDKVTAASYEKIIKAICREMKEKPVSVELTDSKVSVKKMVAEAKNLDKLATNIVVKVPLIPDTTKSLEVIKKLTDLNIAVNVTTMMTFEQMILAILAVRHNKRVSFVSLFWGRSIEDHKRYRSKKTFEKQYPKFGAESEIDADVFKQVRECANFLNEGGYKNPKIIVGSIRSASQVGLVFAAGGHISTVPPPVLEAMLFSKRSIETINDFDKAWKELKS